MCGESCTKPAPSSRYRVYRLCAKADDDASGAKGARLCAVAAAFGILVGPPPGGLRNPGQPIGVALTTRVQGWSAQMPVILLWSGIPILLLGGGYVLYRIIA
jgi:hypothetical protein